MATTPGGGISVTVDGTTRRFAADARVRIGRSEDNDVVIDNPYVSRQHAILSREPAGWVLESVGEGGLFLGGAATSRLAVPGPLEVWLAAPPNGARIEVAPEAAEAATRVATPPASMPGEATVVAPAPGAGMPSAPGAGTPATPGGPMQGPGGITIRLNGNEQRFPQGRTISIGRLPSSDVRSDNPSVSREHATVRVQGGGWVLVSSGQHGTFLEGNAINSLPITGATTLRLGDPQTGDVLELEPDAGVAGTALPARLSGGGAAVPGGAIAARGTGEASVVRRLKDSNRRTRVVAVVAAVVALLLGATALVVSLRGGNGNDVEGVVADATPKTGFVSLDNNPSWSGTGAVIDAQRGFVVTNAHVVEGGTSFTVGIAGDQRAADLAGIAPCDDLAVLQLHDASNLQQFTTGSQADLQSGQTVVSLGFPVTFSQQPKPIAGVGQIANPHTDNAAAGYTNLIQNTATINPGNSGGPLIDMSGNLIGINTLYNFQEIQGVKDSRPIQNQYYAIPVDRVEQVAPILESGVSLGDDGIGPRKLGVLETTSPNVPESLVFLTEAPRPGSPADIGLKPPAKVQSNIYVVWAITAIDGKPIGSAGDYCDAIRDKKEGDTAQYRVDPFAVQPTSNGVLAKRLPGGKRVVITF